MFIVGPDPGDPTRPHESSRLDTLLAWPVRLLAVAGISLLAIIWATTPAGIQFGWALQYGLLVAVSIVTSFWGVVMVVNVVLAALWVAMSWNPPRTPADHPLGWGIADVVTWLNRQVGHAEVLVAWVAVAFVLSPHLAVQVSLLAAVLLLGGPLINGAARSRFFGGDKARESRAALMMERRSVIYLTSLLGLAILAAQAPYQFFTILPLLLTVLPGLVLRYVRFWRRKKLEEQEDAGFRAHRLHKAELQRQASSVSDRWVMAAALAVFFGATAALSLWKRQQLASHARTEQDGPPASTDSCVAERGGPVEPTLAMYLLADTQIHELGRKRFPGQMEVADAIVPVARRPVELDMLSTATVVRGQSVYRELAAARAKAGLPPPLWGHVGDFADLSCTNEMDRMLELLEGYSLRDLDKPRAPRQPRAPGQPGERNLAGLAPGNHDMSFQGNFGWSPYWDEACTERMNKAASDARLRQLMEDRLVPEGQTFPASRSGDARFTVSRLGTVPGTGKGGGRAHGVFAIFVDTSDRGARDFGIAGTFGTFSSDQRDGILAAVDGMMADGKAGAAYADPWFVVLAHHPYAEMTPWSRDRLSELIAALDAKGSSCKNEQTNCLAPRVLALITAHTHIVETHRHCIGQRQVREIVVGSVIDPPEQASWVEIGLDAHNHGSLRLATMPTVARAGLVCSADHMIEAGVCRRQMALLAAAPACQDLIASDAAGGESPASCEELERPLSTAAQVDGIVKHGGPKDPADLILADDKRARALLACICRDVDPQGQPESAYSAAIRAACAKCEPPLKNEAYAPIIKAVAEDPAREQELTCLAWAAADLQEHKATGMTIADALRCAFDDPSLPPAQVAVASLEEIPCR
ncbi:MAG TPA: hypothetical protein VHU40_16190 [Polyangia bacterium]|nr:hypothetical protein [Polyangia bacterium]